MPELVVNKLSVFDFLRDPKRKFVIPEYQRPYRWDIEHCRTLWDDVKNFFTETKESGEEDEQYFLGTIVTCPHTDNGQLAIIDGQQRITTLLLILRVFYAKLASSTNTNDADYLRRNIASCIWDLNRINGIEDKQSPKLTSMAVSDNEIQSLVSIIRDGEPAPDDRSRYAENYKFFETQSNEFAEKDPMSWKAFCLCFLERCIVMPIEAQNQDSALTIFTTLNDRGFPLLDSDIFKAQLYKAYTEEERPNFTADWKMLTEDTSTGDNVDHLFRYYMHYLRAQNDDHSNEIALRKYYARNNYEVLRDNHQQIMRDLLALMEFWRELGAFSDMYCTHRSKQMLHCLTQYPNEYWRYPVTVLFLHYRERGTNVVRDELDSFLPRLLAYLFPLYILDPGVNAVKPTNHQACAAIWKNGDYEFPKLPRPLQLGQAPIGLPLRRAILLLHAYIFDRGQELLPSFQIEHIFSRKHDQHHFGWSAKDVSQFMENIGNLVIIDRQTNIMAGNNFFSAKKQRYQSSKVTEVRKLCDYTQWDKEQIQEREKTIYDRLTHFFEHPCS